jgi:hypothetical protein
MTNQEEFLHLLEVIELPKEVAPIGQADKEAKKVALRHYPSALPLFPSPPSLPVNDSPEKENDAAQRGGTKQSDH